MKLYNNALSCGRLDDIIKTREDSEYSRLSHYNKGLKLLKETLESEKTQHKGHKPSLQLLLCVCPEYLHVKKEPTGAFLSPQLSPGVTSASCWRERMSLTPSPCLCTTVASQPQTRCPALEQYVYPDATLI